MLKMIYCGEIYMHTTNSSNFIRIILFSFFIIAYSNANLEISKVVIWGDKLHSHTHSYIHQAFYRTFRHMGYETYWLDNNDNVSHIDFKNALFITEWQADAKMPVRDDCFYAVHNIKVTRIGFVSPRIERYQSLIENGRCINFRPTHNMIPRDAIKMDPYIFYCFPTETLFMPWATDLLPHEIDQVKNKIQQQKMRKNVINLIGTHYSDIDEFQAIAASHGIPFKFHTKKSIQENIELIQESYIAPAIVTDLQQTFDYIPCRIFKNISYGNFGVTNSRVTQELFGNRLIFSENKKELFTLAKKKVDNPNLHELFALMDFVKEHHTYINRIEHILKFLEMNYEQKRNGLC